MGLFAIFDINSAGLSVEQARLAVNASNIANSRTTRTADGGVYQPLAVAVRSVTAAGDVAVDGSESLDAAHLPRPVIADVVTTVVAPRMIYDPGHPDADDKGFVALPGVDPVASMLDLMSISRSYEANLRAFDITRNLIQRTLDLGRSR